MWNARRRPTPRKRISGRDFVLAAVLAVSWWAGQAAVARAEAEPIDHYSSLEELTNNAHVIGLGVALIRHDGPSLNSDGTWFEGVVAQLRFDRIILARMAVPQPILLLGLTSDDLPPPGVQALVFLRHDPEAAEGQFRLAMPGSLLINEEGIARSVGRHPPKFLEALDGSPFETAVELATPGPSSRSPDSEGSAPVVTVWAVLAAAIASLVFIALLRRRNRLPK